jgi:hypothetical protein
VKAARIVLVPAAVAAMLLAWAPAAAPQFTSYRRDPATILEGHWQSCPEADGRYAERVYDHIVNGVGQFEVHLGPHNEFAIFRGVQDEHRSHASSDNLLVPYRVVMQDGRAAQKWAIPSLNLRFSVALAGGSFADCDSWYILLEPAGTAS